MIGGGGREHALAWRLQRSPSVKEVHAAPGNPGIAAIGQCHATSDYVQLAEALGIDLTVVGPEVPLVAGVVDQFRARGLAIVGPTAENAALEGSKIHSKRFMEKLGIPTARFQTIENAAEFPSDFRYPVVLKTDGLAAGKGVVIAQNRAEVDAALATLPFPMVIEEFLEGEEVSFIVLCDGKRAVPLEPSQDHKRVFDGDQGPNTGGMGAYSDSLILNDSDRGKILDTIIEPVVRATGYTGFLYAGLMMTANGPSVLEFNVRLGDPETQPLMMRLESDWGEALLAAAKGSLDARPTRLVAGAGNLRGHRFRRISRGFSNRASKSPGSRAWKARSFSMRAPSAMAMNLVTAGGRVLGVTAAGADLASSMNAAYAAVEQIHFAGMHYRKDIGNRGLRRYNK